MTPTPTASLSPTRRPVRTGVDPSLYLRVLDTRRVLRGFTLIELMVAVALVLVLILGINEVFRLTSDTIGSGQALSSAMRDQRAARTVLEDDVRNAAPDGPAFIIVNQVTASFRDARDAQAAAGFGLAVPSDPVDPTKLDRNGNGTYDATVDDLSPAVPDARMHRIDTLTFFTRKQNRRQTGNLVTSAGKAIPTDLVGSTAASEAFVSYGHLRLPDNAAANWFDPGQPDVAGGAKNDNNRYATQWILGRRQMLLAPFVSGTESAWDPTPEASATAALNLSPLAMATGSTTVGAGSYGAAGGRLITSFGGTVVNTADADLPPSGAGNPRIWQNRLDLSVTSVNDFARRLARYDRDLTAVGGPGSNPYNTATNRGYWYLPPNPLPTGSGGDPDQYSVGATARAPQTLVYRTDADPFGGRAYAGDNNVLAKTLAQTSSVFVPRCTQFIVEYAGDYITQDNVQIFPSTGNPNEHYGVATAALPDGEIDYVVFRGQKRIRWYGLPRYVNSGDVSTSGAYVGPRVRGLPPAAKVTASNGINYRDTNQLPDVVPLSDILSAIADSNDRYSGTTVRYVAPFERVIMTSRTAPNNDTSYFYALDTSTNALIDPTTSGGSLPPSANYASTDSSATNRLTLRRANYVCAWQGGGPKMVRITMTLEDPNRPAAGGQTFEYVLTLPYQ